MSGSETGREGGQSILITKSAKGEQRSAGLSDLTSSSSMNEGTEREDGQFLITDPASGKGAADLSALPSGSIITRSECKVWLDGRQSHHRLTPLGIAPVGEFSGSQPNSIVGTIWERSEPLSANPGEIRASFSPTTDIATRSAPKALGPDYLN
jgi:hypothetical protein